MRLNAFVIHQHCDMGDSHHAYEEYLCMLSFSKFLLDACRTIPFLDELNDLGNAGMRRHLRGYIQFAPDVRVRQPLGACK